METVLHLCNGGQRHIHCQERRLTLEDAAPKIRTHERVVLNDYCDFQSNNFTYCKP
jgi:hypothetical protein